MIALEAVSGFVARIVRGRERLSRPLMRVTMSRRMAASDTKVSETPSYNIFRLAVFYSDAASELIEYDKA